MISEHPYRERPELPDYGRESASVRKLADRCKPSLEYYATESGRVHPSGPRARITAYERTAAARDVRNVILAHHSGQDRYYHFGAALDPFGNNWAVFYAGGLDNAAELRPNVGLFALRAMVDLLDGAAGAGVVRFGADCRCLLFTAGNTTTAVLWKWNGAPVRLAFEAGDFKRFRVYDFMKCRVDSPELSVGETPLYFVSDLPPAEVAALLKRGHMEQGTGPVFRVESHLLGEHDFEVEIRNLSADERRDVVCTFSDDAAIDGASAAAVDSIPGESSARLRFRIRAPLSTAPQNFALTIRSGSLVQKASLPLGGIIVRRTPQCLKIDGRLDDWGLAVPVELTRANAVESIPWLPEYRKVKANLRWLWDDQYLYIAVEVFKKDFFEQQDLSDPAGLYAGDSFQVCFDPVSNGRPDQVGFSDDDFEYSLGMRRGRAAVYRRCASSSTYDSVSKPLGLIGNEVELAFRREPDRYVYEAAFPRKSFSPFRLKAGALMRSSIIVNLNDGRQRIGYLELTRGIGEAKIPGLWMNTVLVEQ